jgi:hypothetical protein
MLDAGIVAIVDRWDADTKVTVRTQFTVSPRVKLEPACQMLREVNGGTAVHFVASALGETKSVQPVYCKVPFSSNYGQVAETDGIGFESQDTTRGGIVTLLSRVGEIIADDRGCFRFAGDSRTLLQVTTSGVRPVRTDLARSAELLGITG